MYVEKAAATMFVRKIRTYNVDENDTCTLKNYVRLYSQLIPFFDDIFYCLVLTFCFSLSYVEDNA